MELYKARIEEQKNYLDELNHKIELKENENLKKENEEYKKWY